MESIAARRAVFEILRAEGVRFIFGNPGSTETPFLDALVEYPDMEYVLGLHESAVVAMADGYARATGRPAAVSIHAAAGTANALGSLYNAMRDRTPMVIMAGQQPKRLLAQEPPLAGDTVGMARPVTKWSWELSNAPELPVVLRRAFNMARQSPRGPVFLSLPKDLLEEDIAFSARRYRPTADHRVAASPGDIRDAASHLARAKNPVVIAGPGLSGGEAWRPLAEVAERLGAPIYASPVGFPAGHPQVCGLLGWELQGLRDTLAGADLVLAAGHRMLVNDPSRPLFGPGVSLVQFDDDPTEIEKNVAATVGVVGDLPSALAALAEHLKEGPQGRGVETEGKRERTRAAAAAARAAADSFLRARWGRVPAAPARVVAALDRVLPDEAVIVDETVRAAGYVKQYSRLARPGHYFYYDGGCLGWGIGVGVGLQMAWPRRRVVSMVGDGAGLFGIYALWTASRRHLPLIVVVLDNRSYGAVIAALVDYKGESAKRGIYPGCDVEGVDFLSLASGFGVQARAVSSPEELEPLFRWAVEINEPVLLHVLTDPSDLGPGHPGRVGDQRRDR